MNVGRLAWHGGTGVPLSIEDPFVGEYSVLFLAPAAARAGRVTIAPVALLFDAGLSSIFLACYRAPCALAAGDVLRVLVRTAGQQVVEVVRGERCVWLGVEGQRLSLN